MFRQIFVTLYNYIKDDRIFLLFCLIISFLINLTNFDIQPSHAGIDISYSLVHSSLFLGRFNNPSLALTYGPLGFLIHAIDMEMFKVLLLAVYSVFGLLVGYMTYLFFKIKSNPQRYLLASLLIFIVAIQVFEWKLLALYLLICFYAYIKKLDKTDYSLAVMSVVLSYVKLSLGIASLVILGISMALTKRDPRKIMRVVGVTLGLAVVVGLWFFGSFDSLVSYFKNGVAVSAGYSSAMNLQPVNWLRCLVFIVFGAELLFTQLFVLLQGKQRKLLIPIVAATFFVWKASVVRQDQYGHIESLVYFAAFILVLCLAINLQSKSVHRRIHVRTLGLSVIGVVFMAFGTSINGYTRQRFVDAIVSPLTFWKVETCQMSPCRSSDELLLSNDIRGEIGDNTVDVYPWEEMYVYVNNLNWRPRPSPASYGSYTPALADLNARFFASSDAPVYLIWDASQGVNSIDGRHLFFDEPSALQSILDNYRLIRTNNSLFVLRKSIPTNYVEKEISYHKVIWNETIRIELSSSSVKTAISFKPDIRQTVGDLWFRSMPIRVQFTKQSGKTAIYRVVPKNLSQGIMVSQLPFDANELREVLDDKPLADPVVSLKFLDKPSDELNIRIIEEQHLE